MKQGLARLLKARDLLKIVSAQAFSTLANQIVSFVIPWIVLAQTGDAFYAGVVAFSAGIAQFFGTLFGGVIIDRIGGRITSVISDTLSFFTILILPVAIFYDFVPFWLIMITHSAGILFDGPGAVAKDTLVPLASKREKIPLIRASSLQEVSQGVAMFIGPTLAGILVAVLTESVTLLVVAAIFLFCLLLIFRVTRENIKHDKKLTAKQAFEDFKEGVVFLVKEPLLGPLTIFGTIFVGIFMPLATIIFPAWFVFNNQGADALGVFLGVQALGGLIGGAVFAIFAPKISGYIWMILSNVISTILMGIMLFLEPGSPALLVVSFLVGTMSAGFYPIMNTAYYSRTPERLFGRVNGASWAISLLGLPFASLFFGWFVSATSAHTALVVVVGCNVLITIAVWLYPSMKLLDTREARVNIVD